MSCFRKLGIKQTASIQEIKRAYAGKLKQHRPDEDPAGFQEVNSAFQSAIEIAKQRDARLLRKAEAEQQKQLAIAAGTYSQEDEDDDYYDSGQYYFDEDDDDESEEIAEPPSIESAPEQPNEIDEVKTELRDVDTDGISEINQEEFTAETDNDDIFRLDEFIDELGEISKGEDDQLLKKWLDDHPDLYSLYLKHQITEPLITAYAQTDTPLRPRALEIVISFFGLDSVSANHDWIDHQIDMARQKSKRFWHAAAVAYDRKNRNRSQHERWIDESLLGTSNKFKTLYLLVFPGLPTKAMEIANEVRDEHGNYIPEFVEYDSFQFWINVNDKTRISAQRLLMASMRAAIYSIGMMAWLNYTGMVQNFALGFGISSGILFGGWLLIALLRIGNYQLDLYVIRKQTVDKGHILLAIICPIVVITAMLVDSSVINYLVWVLTFLCFSLVTSNPDKQSRPVAYFAFFSTAAFFLSVFSMSVVPDILSEHKLVLSAHLGIGMIAVHDEIYTRIHDCSFDETRDKTASLVWVSCTMAALALATLWIHFA